jgi:adenylyl-sulfate kinase
MKVIWLTGLSGAGKTTIAAALNKRFVTLGIPNYILDGDVLRTGINDNLGFSLEDRAESVRRASEVAKVLIGAGIQPIVSLISPVRQDRDLIRTKMDLFEVYCKCSLDACIGRDVKGLYKKAIDGNIPNFTGISQEYEEPLSPELVLDTENWDVDYCIDMLMDRYNVK